MGTERKNNVFDINTGANLKALRERRNMSQQALGDKLGVTRTAVCHWESGERGLLFSTAKQICKILDCQLEDLVK